MCFKSKIKQVQPDPPFRSISYKKKKSKPKKAERQDGKQKVKLSKGKGQKEQQKSKSKSQSIVMINQSRDKVSQKPSRKKYVPPQQQVRQISQGAPSLTNMNLYNRNPQKPLQNPGSSLPPKTSNSAYIFPIQNQFQSSYKPMDTDYVGKASTVIMAEKFKKTYQYKYGNRTQLGDRLEVEEEILRTPMIKGFAYGQQIVNISDPNSENYYKFMKGQSLDMNHSMSNQINKISLVSNPAQATKPRIQQQQNQQIQAQYIRQPTQSKKYNFDALKFQFNLQQHKKKKTLTQTQIDLAQANFIHQQAQKELPKVQLPPIDLTNIPVNIGFEYETAIKIKKDKNKI